MNSLNPGLSHHPINEERIEIAKKFKHIEGALVIIPSTTKEKLTLFFKNVHERIEETKTLL